MYSNKKIVILFLVLILLSIIIILLYNFYFISTEDNIDISKGSVWSVYYDKTHNYSIEYLSTWKLEVVDSSNVQFFIENSIGTKRYDITIFIEDNSLAYTSEEWVESLIRENKQLVMDEEIAGEIKVKKPQPIIIGGQLCLILHSVFSFDRLDERVYCAFKDYTFMIIFPSAKDTESVFNADKNFTTAMEMLESFHYSIKY